MATQLFLRAAVSDYGTGNNDANLRGTASAWDNRSLATSRGAASTTATCTTVTGPTNGIELASGGISLVWYSPPLASTVTISGSITWNLFANESANAANAAINGRLEVIDGNNGAITLIDATARVTELTTSAAAANFAETPAAGVACHKGDRLRVRIYADDAGTMGAGTVTLSYDGPTAAAAGDSYLTLTETLTFASAPAGSQVFLTDTAGPSAPVPLSSFTGADEDPLSEGGNWAILNSSLYSMKRVGNTAKANNTLDVAASYWTGATFGDVFVSATVTELPTGAWAPLWVAARITDEGGASTWDGYVVALASNGLGIIRRYANGVQVGNVGGSSTTFTPAVGDRFGILCVGSTISSWHMPSGSTTWTQKSSGTNATLPGPGRVAIGQDWGVGTGGLDDFYAATATAPLPMVVTSREAWTSRGAGVQNDVTNTATGWTGPLQVTDTAGGTVAEWYTRPLTATTLGGAVRCNIRALESNAAANASVTVQIARVAGDGSGAVVWATGGPPTELGTTEAAQSFLISGDDLAITNGQRLRIRLLVDDSAAAAMGSGNTVTTYYAGAAGATGDTYLTFTQTFTEYSPGTTITPGVSSLALATFAPSLTISNNQLLTVPVKALALATFAPVVTATDTKLYTVPVASLALAAFAPTVTIAVLVTVPVASVILTPLAPTLAISNHQLFTVPAATVTLTPLAPTLAISNNRLFTVPLATLTLATLAPTVVLPQLLTVPAATVTLATFAPSVAVSVNISVTVPAASLALTTLAPTVVAPQLVTVPVASLTLTTYAPALAASASVTVTVPVATLALATLAPSVAVSDNRLYTVPLATLTTTTLAPTLAISNHQLFTVPATSLATTTLAPTVTASNHQSFTVPAAALTLATLAPTVRTPVLVTVPNASVVLSPFAPTLAISDNRLYTVPAANALVLTALAPTVAATANQVITPATASLAITTYLPTVNANIVVVPAPPTLALTTFAPTVLAPSLVTVPAATLALATLAPSLGRGYTVPAATLTLATFAPSVAAPQLFTVPTATLPLTTYAPVLTAVANQTITPGVASLALATFAPSVAISNNRLVTPPAASLTLATLGPTVATTAHVVFIPGVAALTLAPLVPTLGISDHRLVIPGVAVLTLTRYAPVVTAGMAGTVSSVVSSPYVVLAVSGVPMGAAVSTTSTSVAVADRPVSTGVTSGIVEESVI